MYQSVFCCQNRMLDAGYSIKKANWFCWQFWKLKVQFRVASLIWPLLRASWQMTSQWQKHVQKYHMMRRKAEVIGVRVVLFVEAHSHFPWEPQFKRLASSMSWALSTKHCLWKVPTTTNGSSGNKFSAQETFEKIETTWKP